MLYSTREKIPENHLEFLSKAPGTINRYDYKTACEKDINRTGRLIIGASNLRSEFAPHDSEYAKSSDKFEYARNKIEKEAKNLGIRDEDAKYFSYLMTNLCSQGFAFIPLATLAPKLSIAQNETQYSALINKGTLGQTLKSEYSIKIVKDKVIYLFKTPFFYGTEDEPKYVLRTVNYTFYPDKTMQMSMDNPHDEMEEKGKEYFTFLTSMSTENLKELLGNNYKENDPYNLLAMDCHQKKCEIVTAVEKLSKANPYTMARLIHKYIENNGNGILDISNDMNDKLSEEAQRNINKITKALEERLRENGIILALEDLCNIVLNFFLKIFQSFEWELGKSAVGTKEFDEFCAKLYSEKEQFSEGEQSNFTKTYLEAKNRIDPEAQIS
jgi:hypothetical protein